ncbi:MAG: phosphonate transporter substrate-binding protein [Myxococcaceae bacterium]|nr:phosphonate transporter substrate-binding protein [Myxococcaceae bacterium]
MPAPLTTHSSKGPVRLALPPSLGQALAGERGRRLEAFLGQALKRTTQVVVAASYEALAKELLSGKCEAAWAPPFVCARIEAMGVRVLVRGVRNGASSYRAALLCKADRPYTLDTLQGTKASWCDRDSVGGYLLPLALLRNKGLDPGRLFASQAFSGSYQASLDALLSGEADLTSIFASGGKGAVTSGVDELLPGRQHLVKVVAYTEESPNDGVAVAMSTPTELTMDLERVLLQLHESTEGAAILKDTFSADRFEAAPRMGYRALYRVALASL